MGKDFDQFIKDNAQFICDEINKILNTKLDPASPTLSNSVFEIFHSYRIMIRAQKEEEDKKKYPKKLMPLEEEIKSGCGDEHCTESHSQKKSNDAPVVFNKLQLAGIYIIYLEQPKFSLYLYLGLIIFGILAFCLLPVWPLELKIFIWWVSFYFLVVSFSFISVRILIYSVFLIFGKELWVFPDLFNDKVFYLLLTFN